MSENDVQAGHVCSTVSTASRAEGDHGQQRWGSAEDSESYWTQVNSVGAGKAASNFLDRLRGLPKGASWGVRKDDESRWEEQHRAVVSEPNFPWLFFHKFHEFLSLSLKTFSTVQYQFSILSWDTCTCLWTTFPVSPILLSFAVGWETSY